MALEYQRYGRNKETLVNKSYIESGEYRRKFDKLTNNPEVNKTLYDCAKKALFHRSGTLIEDMYWINGDTGAIAASELSQSDNILERVEYSAAVKKAIKGKENLITLHTHPQSMPPSAADFNSAFHNNYLMGVVVCHDGKIFYYTSGQEINERLHALYIENGIKEGLSEYEAQVVALGELKRGYSIDFKEVK